jgi:hypothetical protein
MVLLSAITRIAKASQFSGNATVSHFIPDSEGLPTEIYINLLLLCLK